MSSPLYIAVDLGAGSGRVFLGGVEPGEFFLDEVHRFTYPPREADGILRWDFGLVFDEVKRGLRSAGERARDIDRPVRSIGIDSWAVDYGLLDENSSLMADPVCYRDSRTNGVMNSVFAQVPQQEIFERTGIQFLPFNTIFQLFAGRADYAASRRLLLLPDLINYFLTGREAAEFTNSTTTQLVNAETGNWDLDLLRRLGLPASPLPGIIPAGSDLGEINPSVAEELGLENVRVIAPATHDTGSAVAGAPLSSGTAYISSGTWSLIGVELDGPLINEEAGRLNFTNEGGVYGTTRFLKNVMGLWILESCRREWETSSAATDYATLFVQNGDPARPRPVIYPDDARFLNPPSMLGAIAEQMRETEQEEPKEPEAIAKLICDSLAFRYASVLKSVVGLTGKPIEDVLVLGGGGKNRYLNQMTADACGLPVRAGLTEATVVGNILVQAIAAGRFASLAEARQHVRENFVLDEYLPSPDRGTAEAALRYAELEVRYSV